MNKTSRAISTLLLCLPLLATADSFFSRANVSQHKLSQVNAEIQSLESNISSTKSQRSHLQNTLQAYETKISVVQKKLSATHQNLKEKSLKLSQTQAEHDALEHKLKNEQALLSQHMLAAYALGRESQVKLLLNQQNPEKVDRYIIYYRYIMNARRKSIANMMKTIQSLNTVAEKITVQEKTLLSTKLKLDQENNTLSKAQHQRQHTINQLSASLKSNQARLQKLQQDKARLQKLLTLLSEKSYYYTPGKQFSSNKGLLPWPLKQFSVTQGYGASIADGRLRSTGMLLSAPEGSDIHAIFDGEVVFAHWLRGYGFLVIIQHGSSFLTLYARCQNILVKKGDHVKPGQVIATVGNSGGYENAGLYFEIRYHAKPQDPIHWLRKHR